jgi:ribonuclease HI
LVIGFLLRVGGQTSVFLPAKVLNCVPMSVSAPHFLLISDSAVGKRNRQSSDWRFVLRSTDGSTEIEVSDSEPDVHGERLELLAVVRGLESLDQPSRVTLVTPSKYVSRGLVYGLQDWRENDWQWECHGEMVPVKNRDLWQRIDRALEFHRVECRQWRLDVAHQANATAGAKALVSLADRSRLNLPADARSSRRVRARRWFLAWRRRLNQWLEGIRLRLGQCGTSLFPTPWLD